MGLPGWEEPEPHTTRMGVSSFPLNSVSIFPSKIVAALNSASANCCGQIFCKSCLETAVAAKKEKNCPSCRHEQMTFEVTHNALAPVHWVGLPGGSNRAPIPGQPMEAQAAVGTLGQGNVIENFKSQFVSIPAGKLPGGIQVASFEANKFPVTRDLWQEIMGGIPGHVPDDKKAAWHQCPRCPVTYVNWENAWIKRRSSGFCNKTESETGSVRLYLQIT